MNGLEWNPTFSPLLSSVIMLAAGAYFVFLYRKVAAQHGRANAWILLIPKLILVVLFVGGGTRSSGSFSTHTVCAFLTETTRLAWWSYIRVCRRIKR